MNNIFFIAVIFSKFAGSV